MARETLPLNHRLNDKTQILCVIKFYKYKNYKIGQIKMLSFMSLLCIFAFIIICI